MPWSCDTGEVREVSTGGDGARRRARFHYRDLPLFAKMLVPFLGLVVLLGVLGGLFIVRDLSSRAQTRLERMLSERALDARSRLRDRELYLIESVTFATNVAGIADAVRAGDARAVTRLLRSVLALKTELNLVVASDREGSSIVEFGRTRRGEEPRRRSGRAWAHEEPVRRALADAGGDRHAGFVTAGRSQFLAIAGAICSDERRCRPVGAAVVGISVERLARLALGADGERPGGAALALYGPNGRRLAEAGAFASEPRAPALRGDSPLRRSRIAGGTAVGTLYVPFEVGGARAGILAVSLPTEGIVASVRGAAWGLAGVVLLAILGVIALGGLLSRFILARVGALLDTNRALGGGDLTARAPILGEDELGELARGVNQMADRLQASHETLELRVEERTEEIQRLLRERTEFFASMSHEFRTPLAIIMREAELMLQPAYRSDPDWWVGASQTLRESSAQVLRMVNDILELARAEAGRVEVLLEDVRLQEIVRDLRKTIEGLAHGAGLRASIAVPRDLPAVRADAARLRGVLVNLVDNAVKYTPARGRIGLSACVIDRTVEIAVHDTGVGIPPAAAASIFQPFFRVPGTSTQGGQASSGLGLALARRLVEAMGGTITFASSPGSGTTFAVRLPLATDPRNEPTERGEPYAVA